MGIPASHAEVHVRGIRAWDKTGGAYENGIVKIRIQASESLTVAQDTDWKTLGCKPENAGMCVPEIIDYSDQYYENWTTWTTTTSTTSTSSTTTS